MADDLKQTGARDDQRINVDQEADPMPTSVQNHLPDRRMHLRQVDENPPTNSEHQVIEEALSMDSGASIGRGGEI